MTSEEKTDFQRYREMYQKRLQPSTGTAWNGASSPDQLAANGAAMPGRTLTNGAGGVQHVAYPSGSPVSMSPTVSKVFRSVVEKKTFEQVYKDVLQKQQLVSQVAAEPSRPKPVAVVEASSSRLQKPEEYITTVYNITPMEVPASTPRPPSLVKLSTPMAPSRHPVQAVLPPNKPTLEEISYQKSPSQAYAKQLLNLTKQSMSKLGAFATSTAAAGTTAMALTDHEQMIDQHRRIMESKGKLEMRTASDEYGQHELYRRMQAKQARRQAPIPSVETFAQNGEKVVLSKHRSNLMLTIVPPEVPAPRHVYDTPNVSVPQPKPAFERIANDAESDEGRRVLNLMKSASVCHPEPPPAHATKRPSWNGLLNPAHINEAPSMLSHSAPNESHCNQSEVLNLQIKHNPAPGRGAVVATDAGGSRGLANQHSPFPSQATPKKAGSSVPREGNANSIVPSGSVPVQQNNVAPASSPQQQSPVVDHSLPKYSLEQLLAAAQLKLLESQDSSIAQSEHRKQNDQNGPPLKLINLLTPIAHQMSLMPEPTMEQISQGDPYIHPFPKMLADLEVAGYLLKDGHMVKRKNPTKERDASRKKKPKSKSDLPMEPFLQNGPCYEVASRLPRCRECGRSAAARSRNASIIYCRFIAFRKLRYNESGQLEVFGFADPHRDPKDPDTSLWSSNLSKIPADLTMEKSKFLLGQVGYKFCELFHQEKEAHFAHMSEDKTIAWKQAVQDVRELCDVCQTTLFNHHWVCSICGFVVCIDCYTCRKSGIIPVEPTTKDKDTHGWLLCSGTKEPHVQERLMLTQIIPSNCLYKLVRQMHGVCALLEIPLNCECPLSKEASFGTMKNRLEFKFPVGVHDEAAVSGGWVGSDANGASQKTVSITLKHIEPANGTEFNGPLESGLPFECRIAFTRQHDETQVPQRSPNRGGKEKQSYSFDGFAQEIHKDGDHFDERLHKLATAKTASAGGKVDANSELNATMKLLLDVEMKMLVETPKTEDPLEDVVPADGGGDLSATRAKQKPTEGNGSVERPTPSHVGLVPGATNESTKVERIKRESDSENGDIKKEITNQNGSPSKGEDTACQSNGTKPSPLLPYSDDGRFKASEAIDQKSFAVIMKQVVKSDESIQGLLRPLARQGQLADIVERVSIQRDRVREFVKHFLKEFIFLRGQHHYDDLSNERLIVDYNRSMREQVQYRNKAERKMTMTASEILFPEVAHEWLCNGKLLRLLDPLTVHNYGVFHEQWERGQPVMVSAVASKMNMDLWVPKSFGRDFGDQMNDLINCFNGKIVRGHPMRVFWQGFEEIGERLVDERERPMMLKLKDWPPGDDFAEMMPSRFYDLMKSLPLAEYTRREGRLNLASRLSSFFVRPDLGPKMYSAYGSALHPSKGTTNLHLDISDAVNVMVYVGVPSDVPRERYNEKIVDLINAEDCDYLTRKRVRERKELPGALWHIYHAQDADKIRHLLNKIELERGGTIKPNHDPIHDQKWYLDRNMRKRLQQEYHVEGYAIVQCAGDAIFIPAGAPHQVRNLHNCIKVAEDFVSPENIAHCLKLTNEFRHLSKTHSNHEDKLQIKNIIYHTVKDAVSCITNPLIMLAGERTA